MRKIINVIVVMVFTFLLVVMLGAVFVAWYLA